MKNLILLIIGFSVISSCNREIIYGNGKIIAENRSVSGFTGINATGDFDIIVSFSSNTSFKVETYENILPFVKSEIVDEVLNISYDAGSQVIQGRARIYLSLPNLSGLELKGNPRAKILGNFDSTNFYLALNGSGKVDLDAGHIDRLDISNSGSFRINAFNTSATTCDISMEGSGLAEVSVSSQLNVKINGNGKIYYRGSPAVDATINGNGKVIKS